MSKIDIGEGDDGTRAAVQCGVCGLVYEVNSVTELNLVRVVNGDGREVMRGKCPGCRHVVGKWR